MSAVQYASSAERPTLDIWWFDRTDTLIDFSSGYTFSLKIGTAGSAALLTKTSGITGAAGAGTAPSGTPNVVVAWSAGDLNITPGAYDAQLTATTSSTDRVLPFRITILDVIA